MNSTRKVLTLGTCFLLPLILIIINPTLYQSDFTQSHFIFNFLGVFLAIAIAIIAILYPTLDRFKENLAKSNFDSFKKIISLNTSTLKELKEDTKLVFYLLIGTLIMSTLEGIDISIIINGENILSNVILYIKLVIILLAFVAIYDIITALFNLIESLDITSNSFYKPKTDKSKDLLDIYNNLSEEHKQEFSSHLKTIIMKDSIMRSRNSDSSESPNNFNPATNDTENK